MLDARLLRVKTLGQNIGFDPMVDVHAGSALTSKQTFVHRVGGTAKRPSLPFVGARLSGRIWPLADCQLSASIYRKPTIERLRSAFLNRKPKLRFRT